MVKNGLLILGLVLICLAGSALPVSSQPATPVPGTASIQEVRSLTVVQDQAGDLWTAWEVDTGTDVEIYFSRSTREGWTSGEPVHSRPEAWDRTPSLAVTASGEIWLVWTSAEKRDPQRRQLYASRWAGQRWTDPEVVPMGDISRAKAPALAAPPGRAGNGNQDGTLWLIWVGFDGTDDEIFASRWDGKAWLPPQQVNADDDHRYFYDLEPQVAVGADGKPWVIWTGYEAGLDDEIYASRWTGDGWTPEEMVSQDDDALDATPSLALDAQDQPWVAWAGTPDGEQTAPLRILASRWEPAQSSWTEEMLASSAPAADVIEDYPTLALDGNGQMHLGWTVRGLSGSALARTQWESGRWAEPQMVSADATDDRAILTLTTDGRTTFLQLGPSPDAQAPVNRTIVDGETTPLEAWNEPQSVLQPMAVSAIWHRYLSFGDSITWGDYDGNTPYPTSLEFHLDTRVRDSEVINGGKPGERTGQGIYRLKELAPLYQPAFVLYMEGTNDVTHGLSPNKVRKNIEFSIAIAKSSVEHLRAMIATLIPRSDGLSPDTDTMNELAIRPAAENSNSPLCDQWGAFQSYPGNLSSLYRDDVHPNQTGLDLVASTFYDCVLVGFPWIVEETTPPETWIEPLPPTIYTRAIPVSWDGTDDLSWVVDYDVQVQVNGGAWTNWLLSTPDTGGTYTTANYGDLVSFRVRGRDLVGNQNAYSAAESIQTVTPIHVHSLPTYQAPPFAVNWSVRDPLFVPAAYEVQYNVDGGAWQAWQSETPATGASFDPPSPQYNQHYCFRARARNASFEWLPWSNQECTKLARYAVRGQVHNVRHEPVIGAEVSLAPTPTSLDRETFGRFAAYLLTGGEFEIDVARNDLFGPLPPMTVTVGNNVEGLEFVLPPQDDVVSNGGFEASLSGWQTGGTLPPTLAPAAHTGSQALTLGGEGETSWLSQTVTVPSGLSDATLSFMVRLDDGSAGSSALQIELVGTSISHTQPVSADSWSHVWLPVDEALGEVVTLTLTVSEDPAVILDEVSLGTAVVGGGSVFLPFIGR